MRASWIVLAMLTGPALADNNTNAATPPPTPTIYKFDVSISGMDADPKAAPATYTITLEENTPGVIATGQTIALQNGQNAARQSIGLDIKLDYKLRGGVVVLSGNLDMTGVEPQPVNGATAIHRVKAEATIPISGTSPVQFASVYDVVSHRRYEVNVSAKKLM